MTDDVTVSRDEILAAARAKFRKDYGRDPLPIVDKVIALGVDVAAHHFMAAITAMATDPIDEEDPEL